MENFNNVPSTGKFGESIAVVNENFLLAQQKMEELQALYNALQQTEPEIIEPSDTWPVANPEEGVIYRVIDRVNTPPQYYSDFMWNGTSMVQMARYNNAIDDEPTPGSANLVKSGGVAANIVYDISAAHSGTTYADLASALGTNGANVPVALRKGGMSIKFIQGSVGSSDNKYVQYRLMSDEWSTNTENWAIAEEGVYVDNPEFVYVKTDNDGKILWAIKTNGSIYYGAGVPQQVKDYIEEKISSLSLDEYEDIVAFLSDYLESDTTLKIMIDGINAKIANKLDAEGLDSDALATVQAVENQEYIQVTTDSEDKILEGITSDGVKQINLSIDTPSATIEHIENPEWISVTTDNDGKIIGGITHDGSIELKKDLHVKGEIFKNGESVATEDELNELSTKVDETKSLVNPILAPYIPLPLKFMEGRIIVNAGTVSRNEACSYSRPILVKAGESIIASVKTNQGILYAVVEDMVSYTLLVPSDGVEKQQTATWTAEEDTYVAISGISGTISAIVGLRTYYANFENFFANRFGIDDDKALDQKTITSILGNMEGQDPLHFEDFELPLQAAENGTDPNGIINLNTATVQDVYDMYDALIARSDGYIEKEILGKDESGQYDVWRLTATDKWINITDRPAGDATVRKPIYKRKVVIDANVHGAPADPKDATMTIYNMLRFIIDNPTNDVAKWLRETYQFIIIPILNPWGFDHQTDKNGVNHSGYGNYNGVNCNDNYPTNDFIPNYSHGSIYYCSIGPYPASEKETQYIINTLTSHKDIFAWLDIHSYGPANGRHCTYCVEDDYLHPYNPKRMLQVIEHAARRVTPVHDDYWFDGLQEYGWSPRYGSCYLGIWCPHMEMACRVGTTGVDYSSEALTSDLYYLIGQLMFK